MAETQHSKPQSTQPYSGLYIVPKAGPWRIHCTRAGCQFVAVATVEGQAIRSLAAHLIAAHMQEVA